jgi:hypothetical protein
MYQLLPPPSLLQLPVVYLKHLIGRKEGKKKGERKGKQVNRCYLGD